MIPCKYPETHSELRALSDLIRDSDEVFAVINDYNGAKDESEKQDVIDRYQLSSAQVQVIERYNRIIDVRFDYEESLEAGCPLDLTQSGLNEYEIEFVKQKAVEGKAAEALYKFSNDGSLKHLAHFFELFPNEEMIMLGGQPICRSDVIKKQ